MGGRGSRVLLMELVLAVGVTSGCQPAPLVPAASPREPETPFIVELTAEQIQEDFRLRRYTAVQLTQAFLDRITRYEDHYNAFISLNPDALAAAAALDKEYEESGPRSPFHGVPLVVKDNIDYGGLVTTAGYSGFSSETGGIDMVPDDDAVVVERLREAGAIILGKTNLPDFAGHGTRTRSTVAGVTLNPYNVAKAPGGSSGGTATAVNASFAVAGLGTETGGSIQNPSAAQALVGVKPTFGLVPLEGVVPMSAAVDVVGPMAKTVRDAAALLDILSGPSEEDPRSASAEGHIPDDGYATALHMSALEGKRFGLVGEGWRTSFLPLAPETEEFYRKAIAVLEEQGGEVVENPFLGTGFIDEYRARRGSRSEGADAMAAYLEGLGGGAPFNSIEEWEELSGQEFRRGRRRPSGSQVDSMANRSPDSSVRQNPGEGTLSEEEGEAPSFRAWQAGIQAFFRGVLEEHGLDALFFPQAGAPIPDLVEDPARPEYSPNNHPELPSNIVNEMGLPVVTVPFGYYNDGTPFVLAFIGDVWTEADLLAFAHDFEQATLARSPPTLVEKPGG